MILFKKFRVGLLSFNIIDSGNKTTYFGYWLRPAHSGKELIDKSLNSVIKQYADNEEIHRFVVKCTVKNEKSNQVARSSGFFWKRHCCKPS